MGDSTAIDEFYEIERILMLGLPPVSSRTALATMFGINPGLIWSFETHPRRHYRSFSIPKGKGGKFRTIDAPRVALKIIQKWLSIHLERKFVTAPHVFGFVTGRSHVDAAISHCNSEWIFSADIVDYFQTTSLKIVTDSLLQLGFGLEAATLIAKLTCLDGNLAQGAPSSPVLSNLCFKDMDASLMEIAERYGTRMTRYADDIVFSGRGMCPDELIADVKQLFANGSWKLSPKKTKLDYLPDRLKVHGLLVHGEKIRLTKGYRNKVRAYRHVLAKNGVQNSDVSKLVGHLHYADFVAKKSALLAW